MFRPVPSILRSRLSSLSCTAAWVLTCVATSACKKGSPPKIVDPGDQVAVVGQTLTINLYASDPDGDDLSYSFAAAGLENLASTASLTIAPDGHGIFALTPVASQAGSHIFDFTVSDGTYDTTLSLTIDIRGAVGDGSAPIFRKPLSQGLVLDLEKTQCTDFEIEVEDPDSTQVDLSQLPPTIEGSQLDASPDGLSGSWAWCPNRTQIEGDTQYAVQLSADDGDNPPTLKNFLVVLRRRSGADCPGAPPTIEHDAQDFSTLLDLPITARVRDDVGLKNPPLVLFSYEDPGSPVAFEKLQVAEMTLIEGDMQDGKWQTLIPNQTAPEGEGATATLWYLIEATDNDDVEGDCDHRVDLPTEGTFEVQVTNSGGSGGGLCHPCSYDVQCGQEQDLCLVRQDGNFCGSSCESDSDCDEGYSCTPDPVQSVDGRAGRQCVPELGSCDTGGGVCEDDSGENDDNPAQAQDIGSIAPGVYGATLCPGDDDWWMVTTSARARLQAVLDGPTPPDMDLQLTDIGGVLITQAAGITSQEDLLSGCLNPGDYLLRVFSTGAGSAFGDYTLDFSFDEGGCSGTGEGDCCVDNNSPGCEDPAVQSCVCDVDAFCCDNEWDDVCASVAKNECGLQCEGGDDDCCTAHDAAGCADAAIQGCVCADDPWCCGMDDEGIGTWDSVCVGKVGSLLCAPSCMPDDADGPCCEPNETAGCEVNTVEMCVCDQDPMCCMDDPGWDFWCVGEIEMFGCGTCP